MVVMHAPPREVVGPYSIYERIGVGGMATVHRAIERGIEGLERVVALKRLLPHLTYDDSAVRAFVREARLAALLQHANISHTFALGRVGTVYFIAMEYVDGCSLRQVLRHAYVAGPPPVPIALAIVRQVCDALDYAHRRCTVDGRPLGLIHRDVSPTNLLVTRSGHIKVIDFGIAQSTELHTQTERIKGKLAYIAPEVLAGKPFDHRSDLFSLGVVFHELLTARSLFGRELEIMGERPPVLPPSAVRDDLPPKLDDIVLRALAPAPEDRWASVAELRDALLEIATVATPSQVARWCEPAFAIDAGAGSDAETPEPELMSLPSTTMLQRPERRAVILDEVPDYAEFSVAPATMVGLAPAPVPSPRSRPPTPPIVRAPTARGRRIDRRIVFAGALAGSAVGVVVLQPWKTRTAAPPVAASPNVATPQPGEVTLEIVPRDAVIALGALPPHAGSPWTLHLAPATYPLVVRAPGHAPWTTTLVVAAGQAQLVRAALVADVVPPPSATATLALDSVPSGLDVLLDSAPLAYKTPIRTGLVPGKHRLVVRQAGADVWSTDFVAKDNHSYRFTAQPRDVTGR